MAQREVFATHLRALRMAAGLTQEQLGKAAGLNPLMISQFEQEWRGVSLPSAVKLADALGVALDTLIDRVPPSGPCAGFTPYDLRPVPADLRTMRMSRRRQLTIAEAERLAAALAEQDDDPVIAGGVIPKEAR